MKSIKQVLSGILAAAMLTASASFVSAAQVTFTDVGTHWAKNYITYLVEKDVLNGYKQDNGTYMFKPEDTVTRAEFIKMLDETFGLVDTANIAGKYKDVNQNDWFYPYFAKAVAQGYIHNYGENATPNGALSREEATSLLVRYLDLPDSEKVSASTFADYNSISSYYNEDVLKAAKASVINGYKEDNGTYTFRPKNTLTRAEALTILYRAAGALFTGNYTGTDTAAYESNAVLKKGNIVLTNQSLNGRVIIGEGADEGTIYFKQSKINDTLYVRGGADITLEGTKVKTLVVDASDGIAISIQSNSEIENLIINNRCTLRIGSGTSVNTLTVAANASNVEVTGTGSIKKATINASGFTSTMVPLEFNIAGKLTATFASNKYQGSSDSQEAFLNTPFMTKENNIHCINVIALADGVVRYYFTNASSCPDITEFDACYDAATYKTNFSVDKNTAETDATYNTSNVKNYDYIVLQLESNGRYYAPVLIPNEDTDGTGFSSEPKLKADRSAIEYTASKDGTLYYMYVEKGTALNINDFLVAYNSQSSSLKGTINRRSGQVSVNERYTEVNKYMALMYKTTDGLYHTPVIVSLGDDGFTNDPAVVTPGTIQFKPSVSGTVYYYYSETADLPTPDKFNAEWRSGYDRDSMSVTKNKTATINYDTDYAARYPYLILCLRTEDSDYMLPVAVAIDYDSGFRNVPEVIDSTTIQFRTEEDGKVKYYYTSTQTAPTASAFETTYSNTQSKYRGSVEATANRYGKVTYDTSVTTKYKYMVLMLEDDYGNDYQPVVVSLMTTSSTGFTTEPYVSGDKVYFKTTDDCEVWYFYARTDDAISISEFYNMWLNANYGYSTVAYGGTTTSINLKESLLDNYPYIVFATSTSASSSISTYPVVLDVFDGTKSESDTAITVTAVKQSYITLSSLADGVIYYYETNTAGAPTQSRFDSMYGDASWDVKGYVRVSQAETGIRIPISGDYKYVVLRLESEDAYGDIVTFESVSVNLYSSTGSGNTGVSTAYGFRVNDVDPYSELVTLTPECDGTITITLGTEDGDMSFSSKNYVVTEGNAIDIPYPPGTGSLGGLDLYLIIQLTDENGDTYESYSIELVQ